MASLITVNDGTGSSISPTLVLGFEASRESRNIVHQIIGGGIAYSITRADPGSGTLSLFFTEEAPAFEALELHARETSFTFADTDRPHLSMDYVVSGALNIALQDDRTRWIVSVDFQAVDA